MGTVLEQLKKLYQKYILHDKNNSNILLRMWKYCEKGFIRPFHSGTTGKDGVPFNPDWSHAN